VQEPALARRLSLYRDHVLHRDHVGLDVRFVARFDRVFLLFAFDRFEWMAFSEQDHTFEICAILLCLNSMSSVC